MRKTLLALVLPVLLAGCAGYLAENYSSTRFDGYLTAQGRPLAVALHRSKAAFVTQVDAGTAISQAFSGQAGRDYPDSLHRAAAGDLVARLSCSLGASRRIDAITVEHDYACPGGRVLTADDVGRVTQQGLLTRR